MTASESPSPANPYAPLHDAPLTDKISPTVVRPGISGRNIVWTTIGGATLSGGIFGMGVGTFFLITAYTRDQGPQGFLFLIVLGAIVGTVWAGVMSLFVVPVSYLLVVISKLHGGDWTGNGIRVLGTATGFLTGFLCLALPYMFTPWGIVSGCVPGTFGALGTLFIVRGLARRRDKAITLQQAIDNETASLDTESDETGLAANPFASQDE